MEGNLDGVHEGSSVVGELLGTLDGAEEGKPLGGLDGSFE
jgi:hypothetical protein